MVDTFVFLQRHLCKIEDCNNSLYSMKNIIFCFVFVSISCGSFSIARGAHHEEKNDWISLFNGKDLEGWVQRNGTATYRVEDNAIVGKTSVGSPNSFLCTKKDYSDFELMFEVKVDDLLNSGVQIRSKSVPEFRNGRVHGPQVEIAIDGTAGFIFGEAMGKGWFSRDLDNEQAQAAFKKGEWNSYRVRAEGQSIRTWVNGVPITNLTDDISNMDKGFIGLQVHEIEAGTGPGPFEVHWRNLKIRKLNPKEKSP